jgi:hypothetical protein
MIIHRFMPIYAATAFFAFIAPRASAQDAAGGEPETRSPPLPEVGVDTPSGRFGLVGQIAVSSDAGLSISNTSVGGVDGSTTNIILRPAVDWFIAESISLGGFAGVEYDSAPGGSTSVVSIGPRVGYNVPLTSRLSVWPKVGVSASYTSVDFDDGAEDDEDDTSLQVNLFAPLMFHPVQHFFLGFGPALDADVTGDAKVTTIAGRLTIGGWL